jgi:choline dehydrogenase-like flavoprotein
MICIIGSGLSAMASAAALVQRGCRPTILDTGLSPDRSALQLKVKLAASEPEAWDPEDLRAVKRIGPVAANGIPRKLYFGSDFVFRDSISPSELELSDASMCRSFAAGGFSNLWGSVIEPLPPADFANWPVAYSEMIPHYEAVYRLFDKRYAPTENAGKEDFPRLRPSSQARALYADLWQNRRQLENEGIRVDYAQLAVRAADQNGSKGCCYCGLCLYGCPYDCKYTAADSLARFIGDGSVQYIPGVVVDKIISQGEQTRIEGRSLTDGKSRQFTATRVILAAGFLESSRIVLNSLGLSEIHFCVRHSDIFTLPVIRYRAVPDITKEGLHTLCQIAMQIEDPKICAHPVHLQFYGYNDLYHTLMAKKLGCLIRPLAPVVRALETRLFVIFGYLHSQVSSSLRLSLADNGGRRIRVQGNPSIRARSIARAVARKLMRNRRYLQGLPLGFRLRLDLPGGGYHSGGVFPMRKNPGRHETNRLGGLASFPGVHMVDSSVLPEISSFPTALTVMANAHRIASEIEVSHAG